MQIVLNSIALEPNRWTAEKVPYFRLEDLLAPIAAAGFSAVEVWQNHAALLAPKELESLRRKADAVGVSFPIVGMYPQFHLEAEERRAELARFDAMMGTMRVLGARVLKLMPGRVPSVKLTPELWARSVEFVREVLARTAGAGPMVPLETHAGTVADDPDALLRFIADVGSDRLKVCWQPFDFASSDKAIELYDRLAAHVVHLHLQGRAGNSMSLLEESNIAYRRILRHILGSGFDGYASIEFVRDCVVESPGKFDLALVLENARRDREFIAGQAPDEEPPATAAGRP